MSASMLLGLFSWIGDFFKSLFDLIPKTIYLLYASLACLIDVLQLFFRKLAGLDVYYVDGKAVTGDIVENFIRGIFGMYDRSNITYSALATVFYSMLVFGIIICFASVLIAIIKSHYTYDEKSAKGPMQFVYTGVKSIINMVAVPIIVVLGLYVSNALLEALDTITSVSSGTIETMFGTQKDKLVSVQNAKGDKCLAYYDMFGFGSGVFYGIGTSTFSGGWSGKEPQLGLIASKNQTFSGSMFRVAAYNANRARRGELGVEVNGIANETIRKATSGAGDNEIFHDAKTNDQLAEMIDTAFGSNLHLNYWQELKYFRDSTIDQKTGGVVEVGVWTSLKYFTNFLAKGSNAFSKFNVGMVWYYYDLWNFNILVGFAGIIVCVSLFINIIMGLMVRFFMCITLFLVAPPIFGLTPLDGGNAAKKWKENFIKQALMAYGAVVGMNLMMMILPYLYEIDFFNIELIDLLAQSLFIIVGLVSIKAVMQLMSDLIGAADANKTGGEISQEVAGVAGKAVNMTMGAAKLGMKGLGTAAKIAGNTKLGQKIKDSKLGKGLGNLKQGVSNKVGMIKDKITGMDKVKAAQQDMEAEEATLGSVQQGLNNLDTAKAQQDALKSLSGTSAAKFSAAAFRKQAEEKYGLSGAALDNVVNAAQQASGAGGKMNMAGMSAELGKIDSSYKNVESSGALASQKAFNAQRAIAVSAVESHTKSYEASKATYKDVSTARLNKASVQIGGFFKGAGELVSTTAKQSFGQDKTIKEFIDTSTGKQVEDKKRQKKAAQGQVYSGIEATIRTQERKLGRPLTKEEIEDIEKKQGLDK